MRRLAYYNLGLVKQRMGKVGDARQMVRTCCQRGFT